MRPSIAPCNATHRPTNSRSHSQFHKRRTRRHTWHTRPHCRRPRLKRELRWPRLAHKGKPQISTWGRCLGGPPWPAPPDRSRRRRRIPRFDTDRPGAGTQKGPKGAPQSWAPIRRAEGAEAPTPNVHLFLGRLRRRTPGGALFVILPPPGGAGGSFSDGVLMGFKWGFDGVQMGF